MKKIALLASLLTSFVSFAQKNMSYVDDTSTKEIISLLIKNRSEIEFSGYYDELNNNSKMIRVMDAGFVVKNKDTASYDIDLPNYLRIHRKNNYLIYNLLDNGHYKLIGQCQYTENEPSKDIHLNPSQGYSETYLDEIARVYNINDVEFFYIYGIGSCIKADNNFWIIDGNERTDLNTFVKETYPTLPEFRGGVLWEESPHPFGTGSY